ncbi:hypothetical protein L6164_026569 [Bauhinia variegata]|uniref:Uncharacterized protein n=1 Tax=Bauhinia variegata TaxID=167791 RepID=A0ACB9LQI9_BAUVA|nr:hypothetical protein L6164_026569 [Bauhinia variegata]
MSSSELHSLAYTTSLHGSSLGWDFHNLGVLNADKMSLVMDGIASSFSPLETDFSTGYLEDALLEFTGRSKRRRLLPSPDDQSKTCIELEKSFWNFNPIWHQEENFLLHEPARKHWWIFSTTVSGINEELNILAETKTPEETISVTTESPHSYNSYSYKDIPVTSKATEESIAESDKRNKRVITRVVYPFALVKPGGREGDVTLNEINERILMPPTRPVKHPVGDFACRPCVSADGPGLSGKAVVALTRIHTQGRGTITIIRTKG